MSIVSFKDGWQQRSTILKRRASKTRRGTDNATVLEPPQPPLSKIPPHDSASEIVPWQPWLGIGLVIMLYFMAQRVSSVLVTVYPLLIRHWTIQVTNLWLQNNVYVQFAYVFIAEAFTIGSVYGFVRLYKRGLGSIGLHRPHWRDLAYGLAAIPFYLLAYLLTVGIVSSLININVNQRQHIGFTTVHGSAQLIVTAISLIVLAPIAEEIMVRGLLYTSFKKWVPRILAMLLTSALFASAHLPEGGSSGPLWIAALDTFVLSMFLIYLREKTNNLWASITLHACKNSIAYYALFLAPLIHFHQ